MKFLNSQPHSPLGLAVDLIFLGLIFGELMLLVGCSTSKKILDYPKREIDRPYTLLEGMSEAQVTLTRGYSKSTSFYDLSEPIPLNIYWVHAVSDDFSFIWFILPLGFKYQFMKGPKHLLGLQFYNHIGDPDDPNISPFFNILDRIRLADALEIQTNVGLQSHILFKQNRVDWNFSVVSGPRWQAWESHMIYAWLGLLRELKAEEIGTSLQLGATYTWSLTPQSEIDLRFWQRWTGERVGVVPDTLGSLGIKYRW